MMNRKEKIELLRGIEAGEVCINELSPSVIQEWYYDEIKDTYESGVTKEIIEGKEFREKNKPNRRTPKRLLIGMDAM